MSQSQAWKAAERKAARLLGGTRVKRGDDFSKSKPDVEHPLFSIEVKFRKALPVLLANGLAQAQRYSKKPPLLMLQERNKKTALVVMRLQDFVDLFGNLRSSDVPAEFTKGE